MKWPLPIICIICLWRHVFVFINSVELEIASLHYIERFTTYSRHIYIIKCPFRESYFRNKRINTFRPLCFISFRFVYRNIITVIIAFVTRSCLVENSFFAPRSCRWVFIDIFYTPLSQVTYMRYFMIQLFIQII